VELIDALLRLMDVKMGERILFRHATNCIGSLCVKCGKRAGGLKRIFDKLYSNYTHFAKATQSKRIGLNEAKVRKRIFFTSANVCLDS